MLAVFRSSLCTQARQLRGPRSTFRSCGALRTMLTSIRGCRVALVVACAVSQVGQKSGRKCLPIVHHSPRALVNGRQLATCRDDQETSDRRSRPFAGRSNPSAGPRPARFALRRPSLPLASGSSRQALARMADSATNFSSALTTWKGAPSVRPRAGACACAAY